ncbi:GH32 C-terminal domain-containing protein [Thermaerobacillus caldiproteolyticus]|uniref:GH32 C-terminal domain-containing protein n=1 Tax=Thermaerobacillus caldiproteolyticus TaxID=247480 RepID=UPI0022643409|nr:GH32 C-terminal domain-containing protein [Anoxybacillus caldiproteolyticus]
MVTLHMLIDHSSLEIFDIDGESVFTDCHYPCPSSQDVEFFVQAEKMRITPLDAWRLKAIR